MPTGKSRFTFMADVKADSEQGSFVGVASSCNPDKRKQMLTQKALSGMASQVPLPLVVGGTHEEAVVDVAAEVGTVEEFWLEDDGNKLLFKGKLDPNHPNYAFWCSKLDPENPFAFTYKTSIGGWVPLDAVSKVYKAGDTVEALDAFRLDHLLFCRGEAAVNQDTAIARGMASPTDWQGAIFFAMAQGTEETETTDEVEVAADETCAVSAADEAGETLPPTLEGKAEGGSTMADKSKSALKQFFKAFGDLFGDDAPEEEEAAGMAEVTEEAVVETVEEPAVTELPAGLADLIASAVGTAVAAAMAEYKTAEPVTEAGMADAETETEETETPAEETPAVEEPAATEEPAGAADAEVTPEAEAPVNMTRSDLDDLNKTLKFLMDGVTGMGERMERLEGKASGGSTQVPASPGSPVAKPKSGVGITGFIAGGSQ